MHHVDLSEQLLGRTDTFLVEQAHGPRFTSWIELLNPWDILGISKDKMKFLSERMVRQELRTEIETAAGLPLVVRQQHLQPLHSGVKRTAHFREVI